jgi:hypothetical protein
MPNTDQRSDGGRLQSNEGSLSALNDCCGMLCGRVSALIVVLIILIEWLLLEARGAGPVTADTGDRASVTHFPKKKLCKVPAWSAYHRCG